MDVENMSKFDLRRELECPVCLIIPRSAPIYQCPLGHIMCSECIPNVSMCPTCLTPFPAAHGRSLMAEKWLEALDRGCRYEVGGCDFSTYKSHRLIDHESSCTFKPSIASSTNSLNRDKSSPTNVKDWCIGIVPLVDFFCICGIILLFLAFS